MKKIIKKHPLAIRWFHWVNFPVLAVMIWSGLLIYWANDVYRLGWGDKTILKFFPDSFNKALNIPFRLAEGMNLHFMFMWLFAINGFIYVLYLFFSKEWKLIFPNRKSLKESWQVILHDLHIRRGLPLQKKYNAAQRLAYTGVIVMGSGSLLTGLAIYKPVQFNILCSLLGGYEWARAEHFILTLLFTAFFLVHVIQVIIAGWNNFRGMVTGFEVVNLQPHAGPVLIEVDKTPELKSNDLKDNDIAEAPEIIKVETPESKEIDVAHTPETTELKNTEPKRNDTI